MVKNFRLYIKEPLAPGKTIILEEEQTHYLKNVVKYTAGDTFSCFDNESGEFSARITAFEKRHTRINILAQTAVAAALSCWQMILTVPAGKDIFQLLCRDDFREVCPAALFGRFYPRSNRTVHPLSGYLAAVCPPEKGQNRFCY